MSHHVEQEQMRELLLREDLMGLAQYGQTSEYELEAMMILRRIGQCKSVPEIQEIAYDVFARTFAFSMDRTVDDFYDVAVAIGVDRLGLDKEVAH